MEKKRIYPENTPPGNIPYNVVNPAFRYRAIVPADESIIMEVDANGVLYVSAKDLTPIVATPVVTVVDNIVTATCATEGAEIFYTDDGSMPSVCSFKYTQPIEIKSDIGFRFVAVKNGMINSEEADISAKFDPKYFYLVSLDDNTTVSFRSTLATAPEFEISNDGVKFSTWSHQLEGGVHVYATCPLEEGMKLYIRGDNDALADNVYFSKFDISSGKVETGGNIMSLLFTDVSEDAAFKENYALKGLFDSCDRLYGTIILPAKYPTKKCYEGICNNCYNLSGAVVLAEVLSSGSLDGMFASCNSLNSVRISVKVWDENNSVDWLYRVAENGTLYNLGGANIPLNSASGVPSGWTVIEPEH